jgi:hypothetical protein
VRVIHSRRPGNITQCYLQHPKIGRSFDLKQSVCSQKDEQRTLRKRLKPYRKGLGQLTTTGVRINQSTLIFSVLAHRPIGLLPTLASRYFSGPGPPFSMTYMTQIQEFLRRHVEEHANDIVYEMSFELPTEFINLFSEITKTRQDEVSKFFHDALPLSHRLADPMSSLKLATSVFRSRRSWVFGLHYPDLGFYTLGRPSAEDDFYDHPSPWPSEEWWEFDAFGSQLIRHILIACRLDPATTTITDLEALDPRVVCKTCSPPESDHGPTMTWRRAVCISFIYSAISRVLLTSPHRYSYFIGIEGINKPHQAKPFGGPSIHGRNQSFSKTLE